MKEFRKEYTRSKLDESAVCSDPLEQFKAWFMEAQARSVSEPNAFALATCTAAGQPSVRMLLMKEYSKDGFYFYTNYSSRKGGEMLENPRAAMLFFWPELERQVRIEGIVSKLAPEVSDRYFFSRPADAQVSAVVSPQSKVVVRKELEERWHAKQAEAQTKGLSRPEHWGGYILKPEKIEFWQGRESRLHDRIEYNRQNEGWQMQRLAP